MALGPVGWTKWYVHLNNTTNFSKKLVEDEKNYIPHVCVVTPITNLSILDRVHKCNFRMNMMVVACVTCMHDTEKEKLIGLLYVFIFFWSNREINLAISRFLSSFLSEIFYLYFVGFFIFYFFYISILIVLMTLQCNDPLIVQFDPINVTNWTSALLNSTYVWNAFKFCNWI